MLRMLAFGSLSCIALGFVALVVGITLESSHKELSDTLSPLGALLLFVGVIAFLVLGIINKGRNENRQEKAFLESAKNAIVVPSGLATMQAQSVNRATGDAPRAPVAARGDKQGRRVGPRLRLNSMAQLSLLVGFPTLSVGVTLIGSKLAGLDVNAPAGAIALVAGVAMLVYAVTCIRRERYHCARCDSCSHKISDSPLKDKAFFAMRANDRVLLCNDCGAIFRIGPSFSTAIVCFFIGSVALSVVIRMSLQPPVSSKVTELGGSLSSVDGHPDITSTPGFLVAVVFVVVQFGVGIRGMLRSSQAPAILGGSPN